MKKSTGDEILDQRASVASRNGELRMRKEIEEIRKKVKEGFESQTQKRMVDLYCDTLLAEVGKRTDA